jgi:hypothetical protein
MQETGESSKSNAGTNQLTFTSGYMLHCVLRRGDTSPLPHILICCRPNTPATNLALDGLSQLLLCRNLADIIGIQLLIQSYELEEVAVGSMAQHRSRRNIHPVAAVLAHAIAALENLDFALGVLSHELQIAWAKRGGRGWDEAVDAVDVGMAKGRIRVFGQQQVLFDVGCGRRPGQLRNASSAELGVVFGELGARVTAVGRCDGDVWVWVSREGWGVEEAKLVVGAAPVQETAKGVFDELEEERHYCGVEMDWRGWSWRSR